MSKKYLAMLVLSISCFCLVSSLAVNSLTVHINDALESAVAAVVSKPLTIVMTIVTNAIYFYFPMAVALTLAPQTRYKYGVPALAMLMVSFVANVLLKEIFEIPRPTIRILIEETGFGFPSGHTMIGTAFIGFCAMLFLRAYASKVVLKLFVFGLLVFFLGITGLSRLYLGVHSFVDILGGYLGGAVLLSIAGLALGYMDKKGKSINNSI